MKIEDEAEIYAAVELFAKSHNGNTIWKERDRANLVETIMKAYGYRLDAKGEYVKNEIRET